MKVTIPVKRKHIDGCQMRSVNDCVMARAMTDALPLASEVTVGVSVAHLWEMNGRLETIRLPEEVSAFIHRMVLTVPEGRHAIEECSFEVEIPDKFCAKEPVRTVEDVQVLDGELQVVVKQEEEPVPA